MQDSERPVSISLFQEQSGQGSIPPWEARANFRCQWPVLKWHGCPHALRPSVPEFLTLHYFAFQGPEGVWEPNRVRCLHPELWVLQSRNENYLLTSLLFFDCLALRLSIQAAHKMQPTMWLRKSRNWFLMVLEAWSPKSRSRHGHVLVRVSFWARDNWLFVVSP